MTDSQKLDFSLPNFGKINTALEEAGREVAGARKDLRHSYEQLCRAEAAGDQAGVENWTADLATCVGVLRSCEAELDRVYEQERAAERLELEKLWQSRYGS